METIGQYNYFVYITTNIAKTVLYTGVTNDLPKRISQHMTNAQISREHFTEKYNAYFLVYWEHFTDIEEAIQREKEIKGWTRKKKDDLVSTFNPEWRFLNYEI